MKMNENPFSLSAQQRAAILRMYDATERLCREDERKRITSISRSRAWELEKQGRFPPRLKLGNSSCAWKLSELLHWIDCHSAVDEE